MDFDDLPQLGRDGDSDDLVRQGLRPGGQYLDEDGTVQTFSPMDWYVGGEIPDELLTRDGYDF